MAKSSMRKIKLSKTPFITLFFGTALIVLGLDVQPVPLSPRTAAPEFGTGTQTRQDVPPNPHHSSPLAFSAPTTVSNTAHFSTATRPASIAAPSAPIAARYPGLPDYPHAQHEYHSLALPAGTLYPMQSFFDRIGANAGWDAAAAQSQAAPATIAVIDTGFALDHESLSTRWATNAQETPGSLLDNDNDGYAGNWRGWDFVHNTADPRAGSTSPDASSASHGTRTAGLASLLNPNSRLLPLQALDDTGSGYTDDVAAAVRYAADHGANVISLSLGTTADDPYLHEQIDYAISRGVVVLAAAGNDGCDCLLYPAAYPEVVAVGAAQPDDIPAGFSSYGANLDILAPGTAGDYCSTNYSSANPTTSYSCSFSGTSFATPIAAGLAALLVQECPNCTNVDIITALQLGAEQLSSANGALRTNRTGYGRLNVARSLYLLTAAAATPLGQLVSKHGLSLSSTSLQAGPQLDSTCVGAPGAACALRFEGPQGQSISGGTQYLDYEFGGAVFYWNASTLGLTPGQWKVTATITLNGSSASTLADLITVVP